MDSTTLNCFQGLEVHPRGESTQIFPVTRGPDPWRWKKSPAKYPEASVSGGRGLDRFCANSSQADFLRKAYPDVDITAALLTSETVEDAEVLDGRRSFDPLAGNTLEVLHRELGPRRCFTCLAFPMGDSRRQLSSCLTHPFCWNLTRGIDLSAFSYSKKDELPIFRPTSKSLCEFPTPILQLDSLRTVSGEHFLPSDLFSNH